MTYIKDQRRDAAHALRMLIIHGNSMAMELERLGYSDMPENWNKLVEGLRGHELVITRRKDAA